MDRVRFGRALGWGTRQAAKSLMQMADAAVSPDPNPPAPRRVASPQIQTPARNTPSSVRNQTDAARPRSESFFSKLKRLGGALGLEMVGVFFGMFALYAWEGVWKLRAAFHAGATSADREKLIVPAGAAILFTYFCVSSFVRANRREKGKGRR